LSIVIASCLTALATAFFYTGNPKIGALA